MSIDIKGLPPSQSQGTGHGSQVGAAQPNGQGVNQTANHGNPQGTDTVSLTNTAQQLRSLANQVGQMPAVDTHKVQAIKHALANGTYEINPTRVANKMIAFERSLGPR
ncbi:MAG TPA: flagellar biosynthesis anti-sigma factor FlgM [Gammaproteobacteria bacterium]|nr:flagellar biosynthesis anti-sigma factor FlgM [Gammaproteobacteria bacterium]